MADELDPLHREIAEMLGWRELEEREGWHEGYIGSWPVSELYGIDPQDGIFGRVPDWPDEASAALTLPIDDDCFFDLRGNPSRGWFCYVRHHWSSDELPDVITRVAQPAVAVCRAWKAWKKERAHVAG